MKFATTLRAITVVGVAYLFLSSGVYAQSAQGKPGGGTPTPQDVNVVNTPTVNIGTGGPIGVDVLTLPSGPLVTTTTESPLSVAATIVVPANSDTGSFTLTPSTGKRLVIKSVLVSGGRQGYLEWVTLAYTGGEIMMQVQNVSSLAPMSLSMPQATIAIPNGPISIVVSFSATIPTPRTYSLLLTYYEVPTT